MDNIYKELKKGLGEKLKKDEILAPYTTFRIGGPAKFFFQPNSEKEIIKAVKIAKKLDVPYYILGGGSNVLISDSGFNGLIIRIKNSLSEIKVLNSQEEDFKNIYAPAGISLAEFVKYSADNALSGLEWAIGIPGTVGGAVRGNAGAYGGEMSSIVQSARILQDDEIIILQNRDLLFNYRESIFKKKKWTILFIELKLKIGDKNLIRKKVKEIFEKRAKKPFFKYPSAGSVFKNPIVKNDEILAMFIKDIGMVSKDSMIPAGYLIDRSDFKGKITGGAMVSKDNANFILNIKSATAENVIMLISIIKQKVRNNYGIQLKEEIELVGF